MGYQLLAPGDWLHGVFGGVFDKVAGDGSVDERQKILALVVGGEADGYAQERLPFWVTGKYGVPPFKGALDAAVAAGLSAGDQVAVKHKTEAVLLPARTEGETPRAFRRVDLLAIVVLEKAGAATAGNGAVPWATGTAGR